MAARPSKSNSSKRKATDSYDVLTLECDKVSNIAMMLADVFREDGTTLANDGLADLMVVLADKVEVIKEHARIVLSVAHGRPLGAGGVK